MMSFLTCLVTRREPLAPPEHSASLPGRRRGPGRVERGQSIGRSMTGKAASFAAPRQPPVTNNSG